MTGISKGSAPFDVSNLRSEQQDFVRLVEERSIRRGIHTDPERLVYANEALYQWCSRAPEHTLYVGVGHGFDALLALRANLTERITGVDPYIDSDGNDSADYDHLLEMISEFDFEDRFVVERVAIQEFLADSVGAFDLIVCNDVLHHIFWTEERLTKSRYFSEAVDLFRSLRDVSSQDGALVIADVERHGLRQLMSNVGIVDTSVVYRAKQPREEWSRAAIEAGWIRAEQTNYVPWAFRNQAWLWSGLLGRFTLCDKYLLNFRTTHQQR